MSDSQFDILTEVSATLDDIMSELLSGTAAAPETWIDEERERRRKRVADLGDCKRWLESVKRLHVEDGSADVVQRSLHVLYPEHGVVRLKSDLVNVVLEELDPFTASVNDQLPKSLVFGGLQLMLFACVPGSGTFRGLFHSSSLLPNAVATRVVQSIRIPFGSGTTWSLTNGAHDRWIKASAAATPFQAVSALPDAREDFSGRVAGQDLVLGNRWVAGLPLFPTRQSWELPSALGVGGFLFLTHPVAAVFDSDDDGPLVQHFERLMGSRQGELAHVCQEWVIAELAADRLSAPMSARPSSKTIALPSADMGGIVAAIVSEESNAGATETRFGIDESAFLAQMWSTLSSLSMIETLRKNSVVGAIQDEVAETLQDGNSRCYHRFATTQDQEIVPGIGASWQRLLERRRAQERLLEGMHGPFAARPKDLVVPVMDAGNVLGVVRINLLQRRGEDFGSLCEEVGGIVPVLTNSITTVAKILQEYVDKCVHDDEAPETSHRYRGIKPVDDAWHWLGRWLTTVVAQAFSTTDSSAPDEEASPDEEALCDVLAGLQVGETNLADSLRRILPAARNDIRQGLSAAWDRFSERTAPPTVSLVTWWARSWVPTFMGTDLTKIKPSGLKSDAYAAFGDPHTYSSWRVCTDLREGRLLPIEATTVPGGMSERLSVHFHDLALADYRFSGPAVTLIEQAFGLRDANPWMTRSKRSISGFVQALCAVPSIEAADAEAQQRISKAHQRTVRAYRELALDEIISRVVEGQVQREMESRQTLDATRASYAHELGQCFLYLSPIWRDQPEVQQLAYDYTTIWVVPKGITNSDRTTPLYQWNSVDAEAYIGMLFGVARSGATLNLAQGEKGLRSTDREKNAKTIAEVQNRVKLQFEPRTDSGVILDAGLFEHAARSGERPIDYLSRGLIALFTNAIQHTSGIFVNSQDEIPIYASIEERVLSISNPLLTAEVGGFQADANRPLGTKLAAEYFFRQIERQSTVPPLVTIEPNYSIPERWTQHKGWQYASAVVTFGGRTPFTLEPA